MLCSTLPNGWLVNKKWVGGRNESAIPPLCPLIVSLPALKATEEMYSLNVYSLTGERTFLFHLPSLPWATNEHYGKCTIILQVTTPSRVCILSAWWGGINWNTRSNVHQEPQQDWLASFEGMSKICRENHQSNTLESCFPLFSWFSV